MLERNNNSVVTVVEESNILSVLDDLGVHYVQKGQYAHLVDHDSLSITLTGKYKDHWMRWSTGDNGRGAKELVQYLIQIGTVDHRRLKDVNIQGVKNIKVKKTPPFNYETMVTNPEPVRVRYFLTEQRKLSPSVVDRMISLGKIVQDGRDNVRFLWEFGEGNFTGADVQGTKFDKNIERGYLKHAASGSKGLFFVKDNQLKNVKDAKNVYIFEAPIDLLSYLEMAAYSEDRRLDIPEVLPTLEKDWVAFSLSGAGSKIMSALQVIQEGFGMNLKEVKFCTATDNDDAGQEVYNRLLAEGYDVKNVVPNRGLPHLANDGKPIKDWNDLLKIVKS